MPNKISLKKKGLRMAEFALAPRYTTSHALIIGINEYKYNSPLEYAVSDAETVAHILHEKFGFVDKNLNLLCDKKATRAAILQKYLSLAADGTEINDRVFIFYAGHGYTFHSRRGDVGYLVPYDGSREKLNSLIRWDELTRNTDLICAKHILFVMDACYGGLAITRALQPGSMRFLKDMFLRYSRQVITAGKADEEVADMGGPLPNHSIFTGHFLEALSGKAAIENGIITANGVMAYVYRMVGHDLYSQQTPHFGYLDGDGDFIFAAPILNTQAVENEKKEQDTLISIPAIISEKSHEEKMDFIQQVKELLSESKYKIKLHDLITQKTRDVLSLTSDDAFPVQASWSTEELLDRIRRYEEVIKDIRSIEILVSYWGNNDFRDLITLPVRRLSNHIILKSGSGGLIALRWYPILLLTYSSGIAAISAGRYESLYELLHFGVIDSSGRTSILINALISEITNISEAFKMIPGHERYFVPRSEYLFKFLQPMFDDLLFLGTDYEPYFDQFEILLALEYAHIRMKEHNYFWGPPGRFAWKYRSQDEYSPIHQIVRQAETLGDSWLPIKAGFFDNSIERFKEISTAYIKIIAELGWY